MTRHKLPRSLLFFKLKMEKNLARVDLTEVKMENLPVPVFDQVFTNGEMVYADDEVDNYLDFSLGLLMERTR